eukprot:scaffold129942_cov20-Tisochrysis_lutea.AAC.5
MVRLFPPPPQIMMVEDDNAKPYFLGGKGDAFALSVVMPLSDFLIKFEGKQHFNPEPGFLALLPGIIYPVDCHP